jgi:hypothetical protein
VRVAALLIITLPSLAAARDESLFVPTGSVVGMFWVLVMVFVVRATVRIRALAIALGCAAAILVQLASDRWMDSWPSTHPRAAFLVGLAPPLGVAALVLSLSRRRERAARGARAG